MKKSDLNIKNVNLLLKTAILINIGIEYTKIILTIELKLKNRTQNLESIILQLVKYETI